MEGEILKNYEISRDNTGANSMCRVTQGRREIHTL